MRGHFFLPFGATPAWRASLNRPIYRAIRDHIFMLRKKKSGGAVGQTYLVDFIVFHLFPYHFFVLQVLGM